MPPSESVLSLTHCGIFHATFIMASTDGQSERSIRGNLRVTKRSAKAALDEAEKALAAKKDHNLAKIESYLEEAKGDIDSIKDLCNDLIEYVETTDKTDAEVQAAEDKVYSTFDEFYSKYRVLKAAYMTLLKAETESKARTEQSSGSQRRSIGLSSTFIETNTVKLPRVELKKFDGNRKEFHDWEGLFENVIVKDEKFDELQKLYYLKTLLIGDAQKLVSNVAYEASAFEPTWKAVKEFYGNKRSLIAQHFGEILDLQPIKNEEDIRNTVCTVASAMRGLNVHGVNAKAMSPMITFVVVRKFSTTIRREWEKYHTDTSNYPEFSTLEQFLKTIAFAFEGAKTVETSVAPSTQPSKPANQKRGTIAALTKESSSSSSKPVPSKQKGKQRPPLKCVLCSEAHILPYCPQFLALPVAERQTTVKQQKLCENCLNAEHSITECRFGPCRKCGKRHNSTLHPDDTPANAQRVEEAKPSGAQTVAVVSAQQPSIVLSSAVAYVIVGWRKIPVRILLDGCAQMTVISEDFIRRNVIPTFKAVTEISGAVPGNYTSQFAANIKLQAVNSNFSMLVEAKVSPPLQYTVDLKAMEIIKRSCPEVLFDNNLKIDHQTIDIIIGSDNLYRCSLNEKKVIGTIVLDNTKFGWVASGAVNTQSSKKAFNHCILEVSDNLQKFFEVEEVNAPSKNLSEAEEIEAHFVQHARYLPNHKLSLASPHKRSKEDVADTEKMAYAALFRNERYLSAENSQKYNKFMRVYWDMDHMEPVPSSELKNKPRSYLPHHAVLRPESTTTDLRPVFNASAKNKSGCSLNDTLMVGPTIQPDLFTQLIKFRRYPIAVTADISKMYRCIEINAEDRDMQRILYRFSKSEPVQHFRLKTVTYGTCSAPFLATRCLQKLADDNEVQYPLAAVSIRSEFYMDDWLSGGFTLDEATTKQRDVHNILAKSHFPLVKYASNSRELLASIDNRLVDDLRAVEFINAESTSVLGLKWIQERDVIGVKFNLQIKDLTKFTKRSTLSIVSRVFDPLGILAPVTITGKILIQSIWRSEIGWDEEIPPTILTKVEQYIKSLNLLQQFELNRAYLLQYKDCQRQLIGFSDASENAYAAVVYLRLTLNGEHRSALVCSKTRVAPIKMLTIPRLELCGAVLLTQLVTRVRKMFDIAADNVRCFSDSTIALTWIRGPAEKYQVFIRNRSNFINSLVPSSQWFHIDGDQNPADLCTRGLTTDKFLQLLPFWNHGPKWLEDNLEHLSSEELPVIENVPELRKSGPIVASLLDSTTHLAKFSSFRRLVRVTAYQLRFCENTRMQKSKVRTSSEVKQAMENLKKNPIAFALTTEEIDRATLTIVRKIQQMCFPKEYTALQNGEKFPARSNLKALNVFLHTDQTIRVGGRLTNSSLPFDKKHPIVVQKKCELTTLIVRDLHHQYFHANFTLLRSLVTSKWWIIGGTNKLVKSVIRQCVFCTRIGAKVRQQIMADLPASRVQISRPFTHTGVDYAGPLSIKCTNHRSQKINKAYLAFFICFATKAVHIEVVSELTTEAFVFAFDRFISRRGTPHAMHSDNATNFVGFSNILNQGHLVDYAARNQFHWKFIPARSPHVGGLWEAAVKAGKAVLLKAVGNQVLTLEQLSTVVTKIEAILNSRPLCRDTNSPSSYLTPGHFLIGSSFTDLPAADPLATALPRRFRVMRQIVDSFWSAWTKDYLHQLQLRHKWQTKSTDVKVDDIVVLREDDSSVLDWPMGQITKVFTGDDGAVRSAEVFCRGKTLKRSIHRLVALPVEM